MMADIRTGAGRRMKVVSFSATVLPVRAIFRIGAASSSEEESGRLREFSVLSVWLVFGGHNKNPLLHNHRHNQEQALSVFIVVVVSFIIVKVVCVFIPVVIIILPHRDRREIACISYFKVVIKIVVYIFLLFIKQITPSLCISVW